MEEKKITQLYGISPEDLKASIVSEIKAEINLLSQQLKPKEDTEYLTRKEVSQLLQVSIVTLIDWDKKGVLKPYRIGNLIRYKKKDIEQSIIKKFK